MMGMATSGSAAQMIGARLTIAEMKRNHAKYGAYHSECTTNRWCSSIPHIFSKGSDVHRIAAFWPVTINAALLISSMIDSVRTERTKVSSGRMTNGIAALESTVVRSDTGSDFQKRMLRSRRSL